jgi:shikimate kinase
MSVTVLRTTTADREQSLVAGLDGRSIVLVGMMGAGKTAVGKRLAARLGLPFRDADAEIEAAAQKTIPEIFDADGEPFFRDKERRVIARLLEESGQIVLATGGGAFMNEDTRRTVKERAVSIWLKADADVLMRRVRRKANRPLLKTPDPDATLRHLIALRDPVYATADITVASRDVAHDLVLQDVLDALAAHVTEEGG